MKVELFISSVICGQETTRDDEELKNKHQKKINEFLNQRELEHIKIHQIIETQTQRHLLHTMTTSIWYEIGTPKTFHI